VDGAGSSIALEASRIPASPRRLQPFWGESSGPPRLVQRVQLLVLEGIAPGHHVCPVTPARHPPFVGLAVCGRPAAVFVGVGGDEAGCTGRAEPTRRNVQLKRLKTALAIGTVVNWTIWLAFVI
jgi:hypothetical protein